MSMMEINWILSDDAVGPVGIIIALIILMGILLITYIFIGYENLVNLGIIFICILIIILVITFLSRKKKQE